MFQRKKSSYALEKGTQGKARLNTDLPAQSLRTREITSLTASVHFFERVNSSPRKSSLEFRGVKIEYPARTSWKNFGQVKKSLMSPSNETS